MKGSSVFKSQKLLKVSLEHDGDRLQSVAIHGDFFLYPEDAISDLENRLQGLPLERASLEATISAFAATVQVFGFNAPDLASAILIAAGKETKPV